MSSNLIEQLPLMERTKRFIDKYGCKVKWLAKQTNVPNRYLSSWINGNIVLYAPQLERLTSFLDEYDNRMNDFITSGNIDPALEE